LLADAVIWFHDDDTTSKRWKDTFWTSHRRLRELLQTQGLNCRIEHVGRWNFSSRWEEAEKAGELPSIVVSKKYTPTLQNLSKLGHWRSVESDRLMWVTEWASCQDFYGASLWSVPETRYERHAERAIQKILKPAPDSLADAHVLTGSEGKAAASIAKQAAVAYLSANVRTMQALVSPDAHLSEYATPLPQDHWARLPSVTIHSIDVFGNSRLAFAKVEARFQSDQIIGGDPVVVIMTRDHPDWKVLAVSRDSFSLRALARLATLSLTRAPVGAADQTGLPEPILEEKGGAGVVSENDARRVFDSHCRLMYHGGVGLDGSPTPSSSHIHIRGRAIEASDISAFNMRGRNVNHYRQPPLGQARDGRVTKHPYRNCHSGPIPMP